MAQTFIVTNKDDQFLLNFTLENSCSSFANSLRRTIISGVDTAGFDTEDYETSSIRVIENTCSLHNEFLLHRIGMIPINVINTKAFDTSKFKFILNVQNTGNVIMDVTTADFEVVNTETGNKEDTLKFFPPNSVTGENILITRLKPNPDGKGEKVHLEGTCVIRNGSYNARFSPVSAAMFVNKIDQSKVDAAMQKFLDEKAAEENPETDIELLKRRFMINESERHFMTDENGEPNVFDFTIESIEVLSSANILYLACEKMIEKLQFTKDEFTKALEGEDSSIEIDDAMTVMSAKDITIKDETHTLGYLLQDYMLRLISKDDLIFSGYCNPHPLQKKIVIRVALTNNDNENIKTKLFAVIDYLIGEYTKIRTSLNEQFGDMN